MIAARICSESQDEEDRIGINCHILCLGEREPAVSFDDSKSENSTVDIRLRSECKEFEEQENGILIYARKHYPQNAYAKFVNKKEALKKAHNKEVAISRW